MVYGTFIDLPVQLDDWTVTYTRFPAPFYSAPTAPVLGPVHGPLRSPRYGSLLRLAYIGVDVDYDLYVTLITVRCRYIWRCCCSDPVGSWRLRLTLLRYVAYLVPVSVGRCYLTTPVALLLPVLRLHVTTTGSLTLQPLLDSQPPRCWWTLHAGCCWVPRYCHGLDSPRSVHGFPLRRYVPTFTLLRFDLHLPRLIYRYGRCCRTATFTR